VRQLEERLKDWIKDRRDRAEVELSLAQKILERGDVPQWKRVQCDEMKQIAETELKLLTALEKEVLK